MALRDQFIAQLETILSVFEALRKTARHDDLSGGAPEDDIVRFNTRAAAAVERIVGRGSAYAHQCDRTLNSKLWSGSRAVQLAGVLYSVLDDVRAGYLDGARELIHGEMFADFLEMASHLHEEGYKDAAAVIAGSSLEAHLKQLGLKHNVPVELSSPNGARPKKADAMNSDLAAAGVYTKLDQKNVTAWLDLRNKAAHGRYAEYDSSQVALYIASVRDFITRIPA
jgi:hypothetical protein